MSLAFDSCFAIIEALSTSKQYIYLVYILDMITKLTFYKLYWLESKRCTIHIGHHTHKHQFWLHLSHEAQFHL